MPANSTTLEFIDKDGSTIAATVATPAVQDSTLAVFKTDKVKGDGYYKGGDGLHTALYTVNGFSGEIKMQASLVTSPAEADWFDITGSDISVSTSNDPVIKNFTGNFVWLRAVVSCTDGSVTSIKVNY